MNTRIKEVREAKGLSQADFAEMLNLKRNSISLIEVGKRNPSDRTILDICNTFSVSEEWLRDAWFGSPVFLTGQEINDNALKSHREANKALVVVNIGDSDLSKLGSGYSAAMFVAPRTLQAIKDFTCAGYVVYSNKQAHKVYRVQGDACISVDAPNGYLQRRYAEPLREKYPDRKERDKVPSDFHLSFSVEPTDADFALSQSRINKVPEGLSGYDAHVEELDKLR